MINYKEALALILEKAVGAKTVSRATEKTYGHVLAEDLYAPIALPSFNNSAMDGYAIQSNKTESASNAKVIWFDKITTLGAGEQIEKTYQAHQTTEIMTGAPVPDQFDAVVPVEKTQLLTQGDLEQVGITAPLGKGENIRFQGEDIDAGRQLLSKGTRLTHEHIMTLTGVGIQTIATFKPPRVLILATGKELSINKDAKLDHQIYDCNSPFLSSCLQNKWHATVHIAHLLTDTDTPFCDLIQDFLKQYPDLDMIISTGAVSAGKYDFIPRALNTLKANTVYHKVAIRPGKPALFATLPNGTVYFGLPGNPSAVACGMQFFIDPYLCKQRTMRIQSPIAAVLDNTSTYNKPLCFFQKAFHYIDSKAVSRVEILSGQESFKIAPFLKANSWVKVDTAPTTLNQGEYVMVYPMSGA